jgi:8-oxo-dGTP diphosphatase
VPDLRAGLAARHPEVEVWAAGGVVHRDGADGPEVLLVHRPNHDDWSLPKGKLDAGETLAKAARREVEEETGLQCRLGRRVGLVRYVDTRGRQKAVVYWLMTPERGSFKPNREVDVIEWLPVKKASRQCSYRHDMRLLHDDVERILRAG